MLTQIISGFIIAVVSFFFGYFLFTVQRKEAIRLELFKKRLDCYDKIMAFMQKIDQEVIANNFLIDKMENEKYVLEIYNLTLPNRHYLSEKIHDLLELDLVNLFDTLPESAGDLEQKCDQIKVLIQDEVGSYIIDTKHIKKIIGNNKKKDTILKHYEKV
ncbi:MAG: hypothetical protein WC460_02455 [Patescibacteria group bacterium]